MEVLTMTNFFNETTEVLREHGFDSTDIDWIGSKDGKYATTYSNFASKLADFDYDNGYGAPRIPLDLVIVLRHGAGWFERYEYDGAESWVFKKVPALQSTAQLITNLMPSEPFDFTDTVAERQPRKE
jgi:hypothetical protein